MLDPMVLLAIGTAACTVLVNTVATTWRIGRMLDKRDAAFLKIMADHELADVQRFAEVRAKIYESGNTIRREFGETGNALREKIREVELWSRDHFVQIPAFDDAFDRLVKQIDRIGAKPGH